MDLIKRVKHHKGGHTPSIKKLGEIELVFQQEYESLKDARSVEAKLKKLKRKDYLEKIVQDGKIRISP